MRIEHVAYQMPDPIAAAKWYAQHLGFRITRSMNEPPYAHFLTDASGSVMIEIYNNPAAPMLDYTQTDPLVLHLAFIAADVAAQRQQLIDAGATPVGDITVTPTGDEVAMLRDPWGFAIQLAKRSTPML